MREVCGGRSYWEPGVLPSKFDTDSKWVTEVVTFNTIGNCIINDTCRCE